MFLSGSRVALDNKVSERALRIVALQWKNARFVGHDEVGQILARLQSIVETCTQHGVELRQYLPDVTVRGSQLGVTVDELLPWNWKAAG